MTAPAASVCPRCREATDRKTHCASRDCGWLRCAHTACAVVWRERDRHIMAPGRHDVSEHG